MRRDAAGGAGAALGDGWRTAADVTRRAPALPIGHWPACPLNVFIIPGQIKQSLRAEYLYRMGQHVDPRGKQTH